jgi:hypothetical protein
MWASRVETLSANDEQATKLGGPRQPQLSMAEGKRAVQLPDSLET